MASAHQTVSQQVTSQPAQQQAVQFQTIQNYNTSILHPQPTRNIHTPKPPVGSDEWLKQRRANHKEVERRRRETINEGINELAKLIPEDEKNKGRIIARAVQYIQHLKEQETTNLEKWTLEKLLCEQAISELSLQVETLKHQNSQLKAQLAALTHQQQLQQLQSPYTTATSATAAASTTPTQLTNPSSVVTTPTALPTQLETNAQTSTTVSANVITTEPSESSSETKPSSPVKVTTKLEPKTEN
ncbi:hypothetical protein BCR36DRAFT_296070 [Piromyces finnis]|uniref:BHLH domain-containing protein n=1 Tax=Piromyces finnis TaxID=1754191 RepID=A0A1Y1V4G3_9FUNG|nr:hypothetical protein BCR36DRAFT_296070 [Piromyces finnis]|eukprot:ORX47099.1 hypothetical protein BCR36DRAFT_296070 [Piromyces finnis]